MQEQKRAEGSRKKAAMLFKKFEFRDIELSERYGCLRGVDKSGTMVGVGG